MHISPLQMWTICPWAHSLSTTERHPEPSRTYIPYLHCHGSYIQERLSTAAEGHAQHLELRRSRATGFLQRREDAIRRVSSRQCLDQQLLASRIQEQLDAAARRRLALKEADRERLRAEHKLVLQRLVRVVVCVCGHTNSYVTRQVGCST